MNALPRRLPLIILALTGLLAPAVASASDFGCPAEWLDLAIIGLALPASLIACAAAAFAPPRATLTTIAGTVVFTALIIAAATCDYGNDQDLYAVLALLLGALFPATIAAWRISILPPSA